MEKRRYNLVADFCMQCSIKYLGEDFGDLRGLGSKDSPPLKPGEGWIALCEGCGATLVDDEGRCMMHPHDGSPITIELGVEE